MPGRSRLTASCLLFLLSSILISSTSLERELVGAKASPAHPDPRSGPREEAVPLTDLGAGRYLSLFQGGLYEGGSNALPEDHLREGLQRAALIRPLDRQGRPDPHGKYVLLSIGMSNATLEFCGAVRRVCSPSTFADQSKRDLRVEQDNLSIVDGAIAAHTARHWDDPEDSSYDEVRDRRLARGGLSELQVQAVWLKVVNPRPSISLPASNADAYRLERSLGDIVRALGRRYPNLQFIFLSSRTYGGYSTAPTNPEPYAYETGFAVKWVIQAQITQARLGDVDPIAGDLDLSRTPWIGWGPYLWTSGSSPRSDGMVWLREDVREDGIHPSRSGIRKVGSLLLEFFMTSSVTRCWFLAGEDCAR